jgi:hypothetical protein
VAGHVCLHTTCGGGDSESRRPWFAVTAR